MTDHDDLAPAASDDLRADTAGAAPELAEHDGLAALRSELDESKAAVLYAHAEAQNVRRRLEKEITDARAYAATGFARDLLSVADNLERALDAIPAMLRDDDRMKGLVAGIEATGRELGAVFQRHGIKKMNATGAMLDPNFHQAMLELPSDVAPGTIIQVMQPGYLIKDRLLRPAMVGVAKAPD